MKPHSAILDLAMLKIAYMEGEYWGECVGVLANTRARMGKYLTQSVTSEPVINCFDVLFVGYASMHSSETQFTDTSKHLDS